MRITLEERVLRYQYKHGKKTKLKNGVYYVYDGSILLAKFEREIVSTIVIDQLTREDLIAN